MLGYCGINCDECSAYKGTVSGDITLLEKAAGSFWSGTYSAKDWVCLGCQPADQPILAKFCAGCEIRRCAVKRGVRTCAACADFEACSQLHEFVKEESQALVRALTWLRERFLDSTRPASA